MQQEITTVELLFFCAIIRYFTGPISRLISSNIQIQQVLIAADRLFKPWIWIEKKQNKRLFCLKPILGTSSLRMLDFDMELELRFSKIFQHVFSMQK